MKRVCTKCGGTVHAEHCKLCELFAEGFEGYAGVEVCRLNNPAGSLALKVHPKQVQEAIASAKKRGVPTEFDRTGKPLFTSRAHKKAYLKAYGYVNFDGGYGD